ncbi:DUF1902 domain-containing protein [Xylophilus sp.]|uniref:DUF1902 domain-containing protein n=1 Tax=Xylophilus sp. TaxID=2653893 RepID=UPI002D7E2E70|nr:DUF1902 domain-containing protein [Xylophilus sp.]
MKVEAAWDSEAQVWTVTDSDVPGLVAEAPAISDLRIKLKELVPELLVANGIDALPSVRFVLACSCDEPAPPTDFRPRRRFNDG